MSLNDDDARMRDTNRFHYVNRVRDMWYYIIGHNGLRLGEMSH